MKTIKRELKNIIVICIVLVMCLSIVSFCSNEFKSIAFADTTDMVVDEEIIKTRCREFTENIYFTVNDERHSIREYSDYIDTTFMPKRFSDDNGIMIRNDRVDNWIRNIVPIELFDVQKEKFLYIGREYGFYFDYNKEDDTYFIYLMLHEYNNEISGHIERKISPLYYEKYVYDREKDTIALQYVTDNSSGLPVQYYQKYSQEKRLYLKNVAFNGHLYNLNDYNVGEKGYDAMEDNGGFFIGGNYRFKGVSTQSGKLDYYADMFLIALGIFGGDAVQMAMTVADMIIALDKGFESVRKDFREEITNDDDYYLSIDHITKYGQIDKYGKLLKDYVGVLRTPDNKDGVLFGIKNESYVKSTFYYNYGNETDISNTGFTGRVQMDIVEEKNTLTGSTVFPIAKDVESNDYNVDIYNKKVLDIEEDEMTEVYTLKDRTSDMSFTAPENGIYTFQTYGSVSNSFDVKSLDVIKKENVGLNQRLIVKLEKGKTYIFGSKNVSGKNGIYQIKVEFTPAEINLDETKTLTVKAGESEFFAFNNIDGIGFNYSLNKSGDYRVDVALEDRFNVIETASMYNKNTNAIVANAKGMYVIKISNNSATDEEIEFAITRAKQIDVGAHNITVGHRALYVITPLEVSSLMNFKSQTLDIVKVSLLDEDFNIIFDKDDMVSELFMTLGENETYYLLFENNDDYNQQAQFAIIYTPQKVLLGGQTISKDYNSAAYEICLDTDAQIKVEADNDIILSFFDSEWNVIEENDGLYSTVAGNRYFIVADGEARTFNLTVTLDCTDEFLGEMGDYGYKYIKFSPTKSDTYEVGGIGSFEWYNDILKPHSEKLFAGETYYLKIYGDSNSQYDITISRKATPISLRSYLILNSGYYSLEIEDTDEYIITIDNGNVEDVYFSLIDSNYNVVCPQINASGKYSVQLETGVYYIDIETSHNIGLLVKKHNDQNENLNNVLDVNKIKNVTLSANVDNYFVFTAISTGEYWLDFAHTSGIVGFFAVKDLDEVTVDILDDLSAKYRIKMELEKDKQYYLNVKYMSDEILSIPANLIIYQVDLIYSAKLLPANGGEEIDIIKDGLGVKDTLVIYMGRSYNIQAFNAAGNQILDLKWKVSRSTLDVPTIISGETFIVEVNKIRDHITIELSDSLSESQGDLSVTLNLKEPFKVAAGINKDRATFNTSIEHNYSNKNDALNARIDKMILTVGNSVLEVEGQEYSLLDMYKNGLDVFANNAIKCTITIKFENESEYEYEYTMPSDITIEFLKLSDIKENNAPEEKEIIIDVRNSTESGQTYEVSNITEILFLFGNSKKTLNNVKFNFATNGNLALYLMNYNVKADNRTVLDLSQVSETTVHLIENNKITGSSADYLVKSQRITFVGDGSLDIIGDNGANGYDGDDGYEEMFGEAGDDGNYGESGGRGGNGTSALSSTDVISISNNTIRLNGGNGGHGGNGGNGTDGKNGGYAEVWGGNGGRGGSGGKGGSGGVGCSTTSIEGSFEITNGVPGCGGNGGNGGDGGRGALGLVIIDGGTVNQWKARPGGNGGDGGYAGDCGKGDHDCKKPKGGNGGNGGDGSDGASAQDGKDYYYVVACDGGNGGKGGDGYYGGNGGNGGDGGDGAKGKNATLTSDAGNGQKGGNGGRGGNGGDSTSSASNAGKGGLGGSNGIGGDGGDKKTVHKAGEKGADGDPGSPGNDGTLWTGTSSSGSSGGGNSSSSCVARGTLITLADGRQVPVESLTGDESLLVWNMFTGKFDVAPILFIDSEIEREYEVINLYFSDGTSVKVIDEHGFWDFNLNKYVFLRKNDAAQYIGHWFNKQTVDEDGNRAYTKVQLTHVVVQTEYTSAWSPVTYGHLCYYVNGMLSMPGATTGLINIFDVNPDTMTIDEESYLADIQEYGLFTYEEFIEICPIPEMVFEAFGGKYLKVAIGKGLTTFEELETLIARYSAFWETNL